MPKKKQAAQPWWQQLGDSLFTLIKFPFEHPVTFAVLFLTLSGRAAAHALENSRPGLNNPNYCNDSFTLTHGNPDTAELLIFAENHLFPAWNCVAKYNPSIVLAESISSRSEVECSEHFSAAASSTFKPICIGWDTHNPAFHQQTVQIAVKKQMLGLMKSTHETYIMLDKNTVVIHSLLDTDIALYQRQKQVLEDQYHISESDIDESIAFSPSKRQYQIVTEVLSQLKTISQQLIDGETIPTLFAPFLAMDEKHLLAFKDKKTCDALMLERNTELVNTAKFFAKPNTKTAIIAGKCHINPCGDYTAHEAIQYVWDNLINAPEMQGRVAVFDARNDGNQAPMYPDNTIPVSPSFPTPENIPFYSDVFFPGKNQHTSASSEEQFFDAREEQEDIETPANAKKFKA